MLWDPTFKPRLRPLEAFRVPNRNGESIGLRDPGGISDVVLTLSTPALHLLTLLDGSTTCEEVRGKFQASFGQPLTQETLHSMLDHLEQACFLEGTAFEARYQSLVEDYRKRPARSMPHAPALGIFDDTGQVFDEMLADVEPPELAGPVRGLIAPHLDYPRGRACYGLAYATLRNRPCPDRVVILGTNHFGRSTSVVATASDFETPLGLTRNDRDFLLRLEARCGGLRRYELDHAREHSIELQVAWLQYLYDAGGFEIVPVLCHDPCGPTGTGSYDGKGVDLSDFARALGELVEADDRDTLIVAGADLSHVGARFGDDRVLDEAFLSEVRRNDRLALDRIEDDDPDGFVRCLTERDNDTRVCSAGCIYGVATALRHAGAKVMGYHQAVDQPSQTCVTCAAVAFV